MEAQTFKSIRTGLFHRPSAENLTDECPFRIIDLGDKLEAHLLKLTHTLLAEAALPVCVPEPRRLREGDDDVWAAARESIKNLRGLLIHGGPGNGKSYMVRELLKEVPEDIPVHRMSRTHVTSRTIDGDTTSH